MTRGSDVPVVSADGARQTLRIFRPAAPAFSPWLVLGLPAMGTPASYYEPFARALADGSHAVVAFADHALDANASARARAAVRANRRHGSAARRLNVRTAGVRFAVKPYGR